jgi:hypothetical protein
LILILTRREREKKLRIGPDARMRSVSVFDSSVRNSAKWRSKNVHAQQNRLLQSARSVKSSADAKQRRKRTSDWQ